MPDALYYVFSIFKTLVKGPKRLNADLDHAGRDFNFKLGSRMGALFVFLHLFGKLLGRWLGHHESSLHAVESVSTN